MKKFLSQNWLLLVLFALGFSILLFAAFLYSGSNSQPAALQEEFAKALLGLGMSAIIGGFIKLIFDENQRIAAKAGERQAFAEDLLNRLRKVFDAVDGARRLMKAHKSAKTYGEQIRENIIPSIVALYDIKRSLKDSNKKMAEEKIWELRIYFHYMIAYLQELAVEYEQSYLAIAGYQLYEEEWKTQAKQKFIRELPEKAGPQFSKSGLAPDIELPRHPGLAWERIQALPTTSDFVEDRFTAAYRKMFVNFYEYNKRLLKGQAAARYRDCWYRNEHLDKLKKTDEKIEKGEPLTECDSMVASLQTYLRQKMDEQKKAEARSQHGSMKQSTALLQ